MNEHIINPWFVYLLFNIDSFITLLVIPCILSGVTLFVYIMGVIIISVSNEDAWDKKVWVKIWKRHLRYLIPIFIGFLLIATFTPKKNTIIAMYIADQITWNKIEKTTEITKGIKNMLKKDVIDIIESITKNKQENKK